MNRNEFLGHCTCKQIQFRLTDNPMFVNCCHCTWCQRETGSAFAVNAIIEAHKFEILTGKPEVHTIPSNSGKGQKISRCPSCKVVLWSNYPGGGDKLNFVRTGTLEKPMPPHIHIFTTTKLPWVEIPKDVPAVPEYYDREKYWPAESLDRLVKLFKP